MKNVIKQKWQEQVHRLDCNRNGFENNDPIDASKHLPERTTWKCTNKCTYWHDHIHLIMHVFRKWHTSPMIYEPGSGKQPLKDICQTQTVYLSSTRNHVFQLWYYENRQICSETHIFKLSVLIHIFQSPTKVCIHMCLNKHMYPVSFQSLFVWKWCLVSNKWPTLWFCVVNCKPYNTL